jgi:hypothetical protein
MSLCSQKYPICLNKPPGNKTMDLNCDGSDYNIVKKLRELKNKLKESNNLDKLKIDKRYELSNNFCVEFDRSWIFVIEDIRKKISRVKNIMSSPKNDLDNSPNDVNIDITFDIRTFIEKIIKIGNLRWNIKKKYKPPTSCNCGQLLECGETLGDFLLQNIKKIVDSKDFNTISKIINNKKINTPANKKKGEVEQNLFVLDESLGIKTFIVEFLDILDKIFEISLHIMNSNSHLSGSLFEHLASKILEIQIFFNVKNKLELPKSCKINVENKKSFIYRINEHSKKLSEMMNNKGGGGRNRWHLTDFVYILFKRIGLGKLYAFIQLNLFDKIYDITELGVVLIGMVLTTGLKILLYPFKWLISYFYIKYYLIPGFKQALHIGKRGGSKKKRINRRKVDLTSRKKLTKNEQFKKTYKTKRLLLKHG